MAEFSADEFDRVLRKGRADYDDDLVAEALRIAAALSREPNEAMVEAAAQALMPQHWERRPSPNQKYWRSGVRAAISAYRNAILNPPTTGDA